MLKIILTLCAVIAACLTNTNTAHAEIPASWTTDQAPFAIADNVYFVGSQDLASYLITTPAGNILINANLTSSPAQIRASVEKLGFKWGDIKILLNGQAHYDHVGGAAQVVHETHALNAVMDGDVDVVESGGKSDFLAGTPDMDRFPPVQVDRVLHDNDTVTLGGMTLTAHKTAGHTRGCTTFTFKTHLPGDPANQLRDVVIVGGVSFWSAFHFIGAHSKQESYPGITEDFRKTFATLRSLPCDVFLGAHGMYFDMLEKLKRYPEMGPKVFVDPTGYRQFVSAAQHDFEQALH